MKKRNSYVLNSVVLVTLTLLFCVVSLVRSADAQSKFTSFDFPGAVDTQATGITHPHFLRVKSLMKRLK